MFRILRDLILSVTIYLIIIFLWTNFAHAGSIVGVVKARGVRRPKDVVVYIENDFNGKVFSPSKEHAVMDQKDLVFVPHVLPVLVGSTVDFLNSDDVRHNIFTPSSLADKFNLGTYSKGVVRSYTFTKTGAVVLLCNVHQEMEAYIVVLKNPYYAVTDRKGHFEISDVPPGSYRLTTWHNKLKPRAKEVVVPDQGAAEVKFKLRR